MILGRGGGGCGRQRLASKHAAREATATNPRAAPTVDPMITEP